MCDISRLNFREEYQLLFLSISAMISKIYAEEGKI